ncbi:cytochrome P450 [Lentinus tigrinus ALCF2SS1-7]|uniref:Cytochrome P450 n=1 Tax=Lentinus tigrinus ALCF2SS1-6 TaxID=1328759 RepID=A0A5C2S356_9APHY|nr:cytochrome P450 [Lentinus tigrinus ALCF2SS1-6]RPD73091.1 cytochrome P450 [Lentinus tigrinus ALCF2SS1-7]
MTLSLLVSPIALIGLAALVLVLVVRLSRRKSLKFLRGPPPPSWWLGNEHQLFYQQDTGCLDSQWMREYGNTWRMHSYFGREGIMTTDPKALQHILHKSGYNYPKRVDMNTITFLQFGPGILWSEGSVHQRHRKVMNPAFSAQQLRTFVPLFQRTALKIIEKWKALIPIDSVVLVNQWLARGGLDIIGEAAFDYDFGSLDDADNPLAKEYATIVRDVQMNPTKLAMLYRGLFECFPQKIIEFVKHTPARAYRRAKRLNEMFEDIGRDLYHSNADEEKADRDGKRDVMSILIKANDSEDQRFRLSEKEVLAQMHHLTSAAQETTSSTLSWMLYELSKHPEYQTRIREEIRAVRAAANERGEPTFTVEDLDSMQYLIAAIKETLRFHAVVPYLWRVAGKDDVIPLSEPVVGADGSVLTEVPIFKGQSVITSLCGYNRLVSVWGEDADEWVPERFFRIESEKQLRLGVYANVLTFSAGLRGCIGWRFAVYQLQAVAAELLETFEFALPVPKPTIRRTPAVLMVPVVEGKEDLGFAMPLRVSLFSTRLGGSDEHAGGRS